MIALLGWGAYKVSLIMEKLANVLILVLRLSPVYTGETYVYLGLVLEVLPILKCQLCSDIYLVPSGKR